jgi:hypothetical protein
MVVLIVVLVIAAIIGLSILSAVNNSKVVTCGSCGWRGSNGRWKKNNGCPQCRSDVKRV